MEAGQRSSFLLAFIYEFIQQMSVEQGPGFDIQDGRGRWSRSR